MIIPIPYIMKWNDKQQREALKTVKTKHKIAYYTILGTLLFLVIFGIYILYTTVASIFH